MYNIETMVCAILSQTIIVDPCRFTKVCFGGPAVSQAVQISFAFDATCPLCKKVRGKQLKVTGCITD